MKRRFAVFTLFVLLANFLLVQIPAYAASPSVATVHTHDAHCNATNCHIMPT